MYPNNLNYFYIVGPLFRLFGYTTFGYYLVAIFFTCLTAVLYYFFVLLLTKKRFLAFIASSILATSYVGIESYTWNTVNGIEFALSSVLSLCILLCVIHFAQTKKGIYLFLSLFLYPILIYLFKAKTLNLPFVITLIFFMFSKFSKKSAIFLAAPFLFITGFFFLGTVSSGISKMHIGIDSNSVILHFLGTVGNLFFPSTVTERIFLALKDSPLLKPILTSLTLDGVFAAIGIVCVVLLLQLVFFLKKKERLIFLVSLFCILQIIFYILLVFSAAITESGLSITTLQSVHHNLSGIVFWSTLLLSIGLHTLCMSKRTWKKKVGIVLFVVYILGGIFLSLSEINRIYQSKRQLEYFYSHLLSLVPRITEPSVFYVLYSYPRPYYPFSSGNPKIQASCYLAGFYHTRCSNIFIAQTFDQAMQLLHENKIPKNRFYYLYFETDSLIDLTKSTMKVLGAPKETPINLDNGENLGLKDIPAFMPFFLEFDMTSVPDLRTIPIKSDKKELSPYYDFLIGNYEDAKQYSATSVPSESADEFTKPGNVFDGNYKTIWQPRGWTKDGVSITLDLGKQKDISHIVWSSARISPWKMRSPTEYTFHLSEDNMTWEKVVDGHRTAPLGTDEYVVHKIPVTTARYVKMTITKTYLNYQPAVDEIEVFGSDIPDFDYATYYLVKSEPLQHIPSEELLEKLFRDVYSDSIFMNVQWKIDKSIIWTDERKKRFAVTNFDYPTHYSIPIPPSGRMLTALKVSPDNFPLQFSISNPKIRFATWEDVLKD